MTKSFRRKITQENGRSKAKAAMATIAEMGGTNKASEAHYQDFLQQDARAIDRSKSRALLNLIVYGLIWVVIVTVVSFLVNNDNRDASSSSSMGQRGTGTNDTTEVRARRSDFTSLNGYRIPKKLTGPLSSYPDPFGITNDMREDFHPVVVFPKKWVNVDGTVTVAVPGGKKQKQRQERVKTLDYRVLDLTTASSLTQLATSEEREAKQLEEMKRKLPWQKRKASPNNVSNHTFSVGRYDENRLNMYRSDLFDDIKNDLDGYAGARTVHIGMDIDGPVGTKVYAFAGGIIHSAGYNAELGDYGNVIVIEHDLGNILSMDASTKAAVCGSEKSVKYVASSSCVDNNDKQGSTSTNHLKVWALYGHLDAKSIQGSKKKIGSPVKKGQVLGRFGDIHENGGWLLPHVHFQLATHPPSTHDMPGAVAIQDRPKALLDYPDPRLVLGPLY